MSGPEQAEQHNFKVTDEEELKFNFHVPHKELDQLTGVVRDPDGQPMAEAKIYGVYEDATHSRHAFSGKTDSEGHFDIERETQPAMVHVASADQSFGAIVSIDGDLEQLDVDLKPAYSAHGRLLNNSDDPLAGAKVKFSVRVYRAEKGRRGRCEKSSPAALKLRTPQSKTKAREWVVICSQPRSFPLNPTSARRLTVS